MEKVHIDLHMHSIYSDDGEFTPTALMQMSIEAGMHAVSIADHNTLEANHEAREEALALGLEYISGIELDCVEEGINLHLLGYGINIEDEGLLQLAQNVRTMEQKNSQKQLDLARKLGLFMEDKDAYALAHHDIITGEIIAEVAMKDSRNSELLKDYLPGGNRSDNPYVNFYWDFCSQGKAAYVPIKYISLEEAVAKIKHAGGIAILAHPGINTKENEVFLENIFFRHEICGLEAYSSYHTKEQVDFYLNWAKLRNLIVTAGSDFHGKTKPAVRIGKTGCDDCNNLYHRFIEKLKAS